MKNPTTSRNIKSLALAVLTTACAFFTQNTQANDWAAGTGYWNDGANWLGGVPNNTGGWAIGNIGNGGLAIVTNTVPNVSEAWAGNSGVAGFIVVTNGGVLTVNNWLVVARMYQSGSVTPYSRLTVENGTVNKNGDGFLIGDNFGGMASEGEMVVAGSGVVNVTGGWWGIGNGTGSKGTVTFKDNASVTIGNQDFNIGDYGGSQGFVNVQGNAVLSLQRFWIGKYDTTFGRLMQSGGAIVGNPGGNEWTIGGENGGASGVYGFYGLSGGSLTNANNFQIGRYGQGVVYVSGGSISASSWTALGRYPSGYGVVWVSGGSFAHTGTGTQLIVGENGRGEFNLSGTGTLDCNLRLRLGNPGGNGIVNLNGGTARVPGIELTGGSGFVNFNGGTVLAKASSPSFMTNLTEAVVYSGSAIFDTAGNDITVGQALLAPSGLSVVSVPIVDGGAGYLAPPIVQVDGSGFGSGATAVAQVSGAGVLTNVVVTGFGYGYGGAPNVTLLGGAPTTPATLGAVTVAAASSGGLIKNGAGTLTLLGANSYSGPSAVNAGKLVVGTSATGAGAFSVANGAGFGVAVQAANGQLNQSGLTLGNCTMDFDLGSFGNPTLAPANVAGVLAVNGTVTVNVADGLPQPGQFPLIKYGSKVGAGTFVLGTLPTGVVASLVNNVGNNSIDLNITTVNTPRWDGQAGGNWDIGVTTNWVNAGTGLPTYYGEGNPVRFDDAALGTTTVNLVTTVNPSGVTANNANLAYTLVGSGKISGTTGLTKQGTNTLTIANTGGNNYTGPTVISAGKLVVTNLANGGSPSAIGAASSAAANLMLSGGTLSYGGPAVAINRGYTVAAANATIETLGNLSLSGPVTAGAGSGSVKTGPARLTYSGAGARELSGGAFPGYRVEAGTLVFDGTGGAQTNHSQNEFWVGNTVDQGASLILSNTVLNVDSWFSVGRGNGTAGYLSTAALYNSRLRSGNFSMGWDNGVVGHTASQWLGLYGTSSITNMGDVNAGESGGSTTTIELHDNSVFFTDWRMHVGWHTGGTGSMTLSNASILNVDAWFSIGHEGGTGTLTVRDSSLVNVLWDMNVTDVGTGLGTMNIHDNAVVRANNFFVGKGAGSVGVVNQTGGSAVGRLTDGNEIHIGFHGQGDWNLSAGSMIMPNQWFIVGRWSDGPGTLTMTGGSVVHGTNDPGKLFRVGEDGTGVLNLNAGTIDTACNQVTIGWNGTGNGTVNLNGGSFQARRIIGGSGSSAWNFNGGLLRAGPNANSDFMTALSSANVLAGGANIDSGTNVVNVAQALLDGGGGGGLTKTGTGTLRLNGVNTYTGTTLVSAGTLGGTGTIAGPVNVASGATFAPGASIGTLTLGSSLSLAAASTTSVEVSLDGGTTNNDMVVGITSVSYAGSLVVNNVGTNLLAAGTVFKLFTATGPISGNFSSVTILPAGTGTFNPATGELTITSSGVLVGNPPTRSGNNLIITGSGGTAGGSYSVLTSTNVAAALATWTTNTTGTFNGSGVYSNAIPINVNEKTRFFRVKTP